MKLNQLLAPAIILSTLSAACSSDSNPGTSPLAPDSSNVIPLYPPNDSTTLQPRIRRTTAGVPHITGNSLSEVSAGMGYSQARDNLCVLAEGFLKVRGERAQFLGPGPDDDYIVSDFSYRALQLYDSAQRDLPGISSSSRAMLDGFVAGYNHYLNTSTAQQWPLECRDQAWVRNIDATDLLAYYRWVAQLASGDVFATGALLAAVPPGDSATPTQVAQRQSATQKRLNRRLARHDAMLWENRAQSAASNAWGIGSELSENGRGALLSNPHFPYSGSLRFYQAHLSIPDQLNISGAGLLGTAIPLISFTDELAWTHTNSTSIRFTTYQLSLDPDNPLAYIKDGVSRPISERTVQIQVANGTDTPTILERKFYDSEYGPMISMAAITGGILPEWGAEGTAYTYRDTNANSNVLDTWLGLANASNLVEFQSVFQNCGTTLWTNATYTDKEGNAFYIDSSSVPYLSDQTLAALETQIENDSLTQLLYSNGLVILDGSSSVDDWIEGPCDGRVPYEQMPKLERSDFVQNSNSSYWSANPAQFLTGFSLLFGTEEQPINPRTRIGLRMLQNPTDAGFGETAPAGDDGKFNAQELLQVIWNNRAHYAELFLPEVRERCALLGDTEVQADSPEPGSAPDAGSVADACAVLANWSGNYNSNSQGAHLYRVLLGSVFTRDDLEFAIDFDPADPVNTPAGLSDNDRGTPNDPVLKALLNAKRTLASVSIDLDATLGSVQTYAPSGGAIPGGNAVILADALSWHGGDGNLDGAFNAIGVVNSRVQENTSLPRLSPPTLGGTGGLAKAPGVGWLIGRGTSYHMGLQFNDDGPEAWGLTSYGQSTNPALPWYNDQSTAYANKEPRRFLFKEDEIAAAVLPDEDRQLTIPFSQ